MPRVVRTRGTSGALHVNAVVGTHVALFGMNMPKGAIDGLMGFAISRADRPGGRHLYLPNFLLFEVNDYGRNSDHSSRDNPFQEFLWGDYTLRPEQRYVYRVTARYGSPGNLRDGDSVELDVTTESETDNRHGVYFNRGVAGSQRYAEKFKNQPPNRAGPEAYDWLQRGLLRGMYEFIRQADGPRKGLRAAVYEFTYDEIVREFAKAAQAGADVAIVYDGVKGNKNDYPARKNDELIRAHGLDAVSTKRTNTKIAHNKFIVLLERGRPTEVWTGSTNFTEGGIFGQSNVGHVIRDRRVAQRYLDFWHELQADHDRPTTRRWTGLSTPTPDGATRRGASVSIFSPRAGLSALEWYAGRMDAATESVLLTAAFGVSKPIRAIFERQKPYLRYLLLDKPGEVTTINRNPANRAVAGGYLGRRSSRWRQWLEERLTDLNSHVRFVHTKYMLIDPLSDDPIVITGSANFSEASTTMNDENMLVIRGDTRVADIYLTEFMRLFTHFRFRAKTETPKNQPIPSVENPGPPMARKLYLRETDYWARRFYYENSPRTKERELFGRR
jgi:phosphatidylserine/phosphatidylglycerophosphate/cardiolipin synthase-like enzyme